MKKSGNKREKEGERESRKQGREEAVRQRGHGAKGITLWRRLPSEAAKTKKGIKVRSSYQPLKACAKEVTSHVPATIQWPCLQGTLWLGGFQIGSRIKQYTSLRREGRAGFTELHARMSLLWGYSKCCIEKASQLCFIRCLDSPQRRGCRALLWKTSAGSEIGLSKHWRRKPGGT